MCSPFPYPLAPVVGLFPALQLLLDCFPSGVRLHAPCAQAKPKFIQPICALLPFSISVELEGLAREGVTAEELVECRSTR